MNRRHVLIALLSLGTFIIVGPAVAPVQTNSVVMASAAVSNIVANVTADTIKPPECHDTVLTKVVTNDSGATVSGTDDNELVLATSANSELDGGNGDDCIIASSDGVVTIDGGAGNDVCLGNQFTVFENCEVRYINGVMQ